MEHFKGSKDAPIELTEFLDFECTWCNNSYYVVNQLLRRFGPELRYSVKHFPNTNLHPNSMICALAAEAAACQQSFWPMHDAIFRHQKKLSVSFIRELALQIGLDLARFDDDRNSESLYRKVKGQYSLGKSMGVVDTPSFFINGKRYHGSWHFDQLSQALTNVQLAKYQSL